MDENRKWLNSPIIIYGPRKAGTTLLQNLLDNSEKIMMIPGELKIKHIYSFKKDAKSELFIKRGRSLFIENFNLTNNKIHLAKDNFSIGTLPNVIANNKFDSNKYLHQISNLLKEAPHKWKEIIEKDVLAFYDSLKYKKQYKFWASKEVGGSPKTIIKFIKDNFPKTKFVFIARDPKFVVRSIINDRKRKNIRLNTIQIINEFREVGNIINFYNKIYNKKFNQIIFYEDLIHKTEQIMKSISNFVGINYSDIMIKPTILGEQTKVPTSSKNVNHVFINNIKWTDNLSTREKFAINLARIYTRILMTFNKNRISYSDLRTKMNLV